MGHRAQGCILQVVRWLPQNDILAHPRTRAFLSHCGVNSMYEVGTCDNAH